MWTNFFQWKGLYNCTRGQLGFIDFLFFISVGRDIKGANLLVDSCGVVKLADFGMAKHVSSGSFFIPFFRLSFFTLLFLLDIVEMLFDLLNI